MTAGIPNAAKRATSVPAVLGDRDTSGRRHELGCGRGRKTWQRTGCDVQYLDLEPVEQRLQQTDRAVRVPVGREPEIDLDHALVRDDVGRHATADAHGVQTLAIPTPVDVDRSGLEAAQPIQYLARVVDGIVAEPRASGMRPSAAHGDGDGCGALTAGLHLPVGRFAEDGQVGSQPLGQLTLDPGQAVELVLDLLALVEHESQIARGVRQGRGEMKQHGIAGLHVRCPATVQRVTVEP